MVKNITDYPAAAGVLPELLALGHYSDIRELGKGGMGVVYLATNTLLDRPEVLKVANRELLARAGKGAAERFQREMQSAARLKSPYVVGAYSAYQQGEVLVFAMEYAAGEDLAKVLDRRGRLSVSTACYYVYCAALGLQVAHEHGMAHRDIKPQNLILTADHKGKPLVMVLDLGLAKVTKEAGGTDITGGGAMMGTPTYMAPEQWRDAAAVDIRADIYSLGCTLYSLLTGGPPFRGNQFELMLAHTSAVPVALHLARPEVPAELSAAVAKMLAKEPADRFQTPAEVAAAVRPFVRSSATGKRQADEPKPPPPPPVRVATGIHESAKLSPETVPPAKRSTVVRPAARVPETSETTTVAAAPARRSWRPALAAGVVLAGVVAALVLGGVFKAKTPNGTLVIENVPADAEVLLDGATATVTRNGETVTLTAVKGPHALKVVQGGKELLAKDEVVVAVGGEPLRVRVEPLVIAEPPPESPTSDAETQFEIARPKNSPAPPAEPPVSPDGYARWLADGQLNLAVKGVGSGSSYTLWKFKDGVLVSEDDRASIVYFLPVMQDFDLRAEVQCESGKGGLLVRTTKPADTRYTWYEVPIRDDSQPLTLGRGTFLSPNRLAPLGTSTQPLPPAGQWHLIEVSARKNQFTVRLDGGPTLVATDPTNALPQGMIGFRAYPKAVIKVRRVEVKSLDPPSSQQKAADSPKVKDATQATETPTFPGFTPLFNGRDLTGWKRPAGAPDEWKVVDGVLTARGPDNHATLFTTEQYADFHLRAECRVNNGGNGGLLFRSRAVHQTGIPGYEAELLFSKLSKKEEMLRETGALLFNGRLLTRPTKAVGSPGKWLTYEVRAVGNRVTLAVDGVTTVEHVDPNGTHRRGYVAVQKMGVGTVAEYRKIELRPLSPTDDPAVKPVPPAADGPIMSRFAAGDADGWTVRQKEKRPNQSQSSTVVEWQGEWAVRGEDASPSSRPSSYWGWQAPAKYRGNQSRLFGRDLTYRLFLTQVEANAVKSRKWMFDGSVILSGAGKSLCLNGRTAPTAGRWLDQRVRLDGSGGWTLDDRPATDADLREVLANVTDLFIKGEYCTTAHAGYLANVVFGADK
jgi:serine/threonine protein kinase